MTDKQIAWFILACFTVLLTIVLIGTWMDKHYDLQKSILQKGTNATLDTR